MKSYEKYRAIVEWLVSKKGTTLKAAIAEAGVPGDLAPLVEAYFGDPVDIRPPSILTRAEQGITFCDPTRAAGYYQDGFEKFLLDVRGWNPTTVRSIVTASSAIVRKLPDPNVSANFSFRGLVIGHIQSGKTASMASLIASAADCGYMLIIVLAGLYKDLRCQTQRRLNQEVTGRNDHPCAEHDVRAQPWVSLTPSELKLDFDPGTIRDVSLHLPKLAVIKKNVRVLERFNRWLSQLPCDRAALPALILDDEADQASIDTNYGKQDDYGNPVDPSKTNAEIRDMLSLLPKHVYAGYTATPFANVLIDRETTDDLYPRNFIVSLPEPSGYLGPRQLFGLGMAPSELSPDVPESPQLNIIREISAAEGRNLRTIPSGSACPETLETSFISFVLACCARLCRGQTNDHFSMFIHPSYATDRQDVFRSIMESQIRLFQAALSYPSNPAFKQIEEKAKTLWENDFLNVTRSRPEGASLARPFPEIWAFAKEIVDSIELKLLNYNSEDELEYTSGTPRRYVIVGGNRLSRGLTLEGLTVSVFLRDANTYDTLLQMGRWFGYRPGYADLTRIFVEDDIAEKFEDLARIELELREDLEKYAQEPNPPSPEEVAPRIRTHPIMLVTSPNKQGAGMPDVFTLSGRPRETVSFPSDNVDFLRQNVRVAKEFVGSLGKPFKTEKGTHYWKDIPATVIREFVEHYIFSEKSPVVNKRIIGNYIAAANSHGELTSWDVMLPSGNPKYSEFEWAKGIKSRRIFRSPRTRRSISVLRNPQDIDSWKKTLGRSGDEPGVGALILYVIDKDSASEKTGMRFFNSGETAEDLVGALFSFPRPRAFSPVTYLTQETSS